MINPYIYIDDSGSPGTNIQNPVYLPSTKLYTAVIIRASEKRKIEKKLSQELNRLRKKYNGVKEFHAKYIYSGSKEFKDLTEDERLNIFEKMVHYYNEFRFPIICHAVSKEAIFNAGYSENVLNFKIDNFKISKPEDLALMTLIGECDLNIKKNQTKYGKDSVPQVIVDEGRQKSGTKQSIRFSAEKIKEINYLNSENEILLQFVDFFAFIINRCQINFVKEQSNFDKLFMKIIGKINYNMQGDYIKIAYNDLNETQKEDYLKKINSIKESKKTEEPFVRHLVEKTNRTCVAIENIKKYMDDNDIK